MIYSLGKLFFDRIPILVKYNGWVFLGNWTKINRFSWGIFSIEWKHFNYSFNNENDRKKLLQFFLKKIIHKENPSMILFLIVIQNLENLNSISIPFHNNSRSFHSIPQTFNNFHSISIPFHEFFLIPHSIPFHSTQYFNKKIFKTLIFTFNKREFYNKVFLLWIINKQLVLFIRKCWNL